MRIRLIVVSLFLALSFATPAAADLVASHGACGGTTPEDDGCSFRTWINGITMVSATGDPDFTGAISVVVSLCLEWNCFFLLTWYDCAITAGVGVCAVTHPSGPILPGLNGEVQVDADTYGVVADGTWRVSLDQLAPDVVS